VNPRKGITAENRDRLEVLHRHFSGPFSVENAADVLSLESPRCRRLLAQFVTQGWLARIRRNVYRVVPLGASAPAEWREDPWLVATHVFAPCYLAGWTACEHWGMTEQLFRDIVVVTNRIVRYRDEEIQGARYLLNVRRRGAFFGLRNVWRGQIAVQVSDPTRTAIDLLDCPAMGGGARSVFEILNNYFSSKHRDDKLLVDYAKRLGNRTVYKRLGYCAEILKLDAPDLVRTCRERMSAGISLLDPAGPKTGDVLKRWNLRLNVGDLAPAAQS
jgi:predicted transcriptional regulator of viral defense system